MDSPTSSSTVLAPVLPTQTPPINSKISPWLSSIVYPLGNRVVLPLYFGPIHVTGQENLLYSGPVILAPTHRSRWDALIVPHVTGRAVTGRYLRFMVTADEVKGVQGWLIQRLGGFPVNPRQPGIASLRYGVELLQRGEMLVIFPEGGIFRDGHLHPLKPGLARLALQAESVQPGLNVKIIPIHIQYGETFPTWGTDVTVRIGTPMSVSDYNQGAPKDAAKQLTADLRTALQTLGTESHAQPSSNCQMAGTVSTERKLAPQ